MSTAPDMLEALETIMDIGDKACRDIARAAIKKARGTGLFDSATAKQPEGTTKLGKALQNIDVTKRVLVENSCPSEFGLEDCEFNPETGCTLCCEDCWNQEVEERAAVRYAVARIGVVGIIRRFKMLWQMPWRKRGR